MNKSQLLKLIRNGQISDRSCLETGQLITANEGYYMLANESYCESVDINLIIYEVTQGEYHSKEDLYEEGSDYYYWTTQENEIRILENILNNGKYYNLKGQMIKL